MFLSTYQRHTFSTFMNMDRSIESWNVLKWNGKNYIGIKGSAVFKTSSWLLNIGQSVESRINEGWRVCPEAEVALEAVMRRRWGSCWGMSFSGRRKRLIGFFEHAKKIPLLILFLQDNTVTESRCAQTTWLRSRYSDRTRCQIQTEMFSYYHKQNSPLFFLH